MPQCLLHRAGFSLVELSIVLVILGLLTGGILGGKSLIRAAELRAVTSEFQQWQTAINTFRQKYNALPGDMPNATRFWGRADNGSFSGQCASPATNTSSGKLTCNGNGDGWVEGVSSNERYRFWQHLANAGLIQGEYTGVVGPDGGEHHVIGENAPASKISGAGWSLESHAKHVLGNGAGVTFWTSPGSRYHMLAFGAQHPNHDTSIKGVLNPEEAWGIDVKLDDGKPGLGRMQSNVLDNCADTTDLGAYQTAEYALTNKAGLCAMLFPDAL